LKNFKIGLEKQPAENSNSRLLSFLFLLFYNIYITGGHFHGNKEHYTGIKK